MKVNITNGKAGKDKLTRRELYKLGKNMMYALPLLELGREIVLDSVKNSEAVYAAGFHGNFTPNFICGYLSLRKEGKQYIFDNMSFEYVAKIFCLVQLGAELATEAVLRCAYKRKSEDAPCDFSPLQAIFFGYDASKEIFKDETFMSDVLSTWNKIIFDDGMKKVGYAIRSFKEKFLAEQEKNEQEKQKQEKRNSAIRDDWGDFDLAAD